MLFVRICGKVAILNLFFSYLILANTLEGTRLYYITPTSQPREMVDFPSSVQKSPSAVFPPNPGGGRGPDVSPVWRAEIRPGRDSTSKQRPLSCAVRTATRDDKCVVDGGSKTRLSHIE